MTEASWITLGLVLASVIYAVLTNGLGLGKPLDLSGVMNAAWVGMPQFAKPIFDANAMLLIVPVVIILVAENLGHIKAVTAMPEVKEAPVIPAKTRPIKNHQRLGAKP